MLAYVARRLAMAVGTILAAVVISFLLVHASDAHPRRGPPRTRRHRGADRRGERGAGLEPPAGRPVLRLPGRPRPGRPGDVAHRRPLDRRRPGRPGAGHRVHRPLRDAALGRRGRAPRRHRRRPRRADVAGSSRPAAGSRSPCRPSGSAILLVYVLAIQLAWLPATGYVPFATDPVGWFTSILDPRAHADHRRRGHHRPDRERRHARGARPGAHPHPAGDGHTGVADPLRARAALRQPPGRVGAGHPVHRPVRRLGDHREPLRAARARARPASPPRPPATSRP